MNRITCKEQIITYAKINFGVIIFNTCLSKKKKKCKIYYNFRKKKKNRMN